MKLEEIPRLKRELREAEVREWWFLIALNILIIFFN